MTFTEFIQLHYGTKAQFAREMGVKYITVIRWCKRPQMLKVEQLEKIAKRTGVGLCEVTSTITNDTIL